jgi:hypothetical protein
MFCEEKVNELINANMRKKYKKEEKKKKKR